MSLKREVKVLRQENHYLRQQVRIIEPLYIIEIRMSHCAKVMKIPKVFYDVWEIDFVISDQVIFYCIPRTKYVRGILWFSRRSAASASADTSSFSR